MGGGEKEKWCFSEGRKSVGGEGYLRVLGEKENRWSSEGERKSTGGGLFKSIVGKSLEREAVVF